MNGGNVVALDTNQAIKVLNAAENTGQWVWHYEIVVLPVTVVGELYYGALNSAHAAKNCDRVRHFVSHCEVRTVEEKTSKIYADIRRELKIKGKPIPENDIWIAAICIGGNLTLATGDLHFEHIEELDIEKGS